MGELRKLARRIFDLSRRQIWAGGEEGYHGPGQNWPAGLEKVTWSNGVTWTLSPEVELGGILLRVCVAWDGDKGELYGDHKVRVFADGELKYPGGTYTAVNREGILWSHRDAWSWKIASMERQDGGRTGRVEARDLLLVEAKKRLKGVQTRHEIPDRCPHCGNDPLDPLLLEEFDEDDLLK